MPRKTFRGEIQQVKDNVIMLGSMVEQAILTSVDALYNQVYRELMTFVIQDPKAIEAQGEMVEIKSTHDEFWKKQPKV